MLGAIISGAAGVGSMVTNAIAGSKAAKRAEKRIAQEKEDNENWYNRRYNEDATQRADAQRIITQTNDAIKKRNMASQGTQAVMGGTDASTAATQQANANGMANAVSAIAAQGDARKDKIEDQYLANKRNIENQQNSIDENKAANIANIAQTGLSTAASIAGSLDEGKKTTKGV